MPTPARMFSFNAYGNDLVSDLGHVDASDFDVLLFHVVLLLWVKDFDHEYPSGDTRKSVWVIVISIFELLQRDVVLVNVSGAVFESVQFKLQTGGHGIYVVLTISLYLMLFAVGMFGGEDFDFDEGTVVTSRDRGEISFSPFNLDAYGLHGFSFRLCTMYRHM